MDPILQALIEGAKTAGPFGTLLMTVLWWLERSERKEIQKERNDLVKSVFDAIAALKELRKLLRGDNGD